MILDSMERGTESALNGEIEEHFRNICESFSTVFDKNDNEPKSPRFADDELLNDLGNDSIDEGVTAKVVKQTKKLKVKPVPHHLRGTAASRAR